MSGNHQGEGHRHADPSSPPLNYCPSCGTELVDRHAFGRLRRFCSSCHRVVFREHKVAAAMLVTDHQDRLLLVRRAWEPKQGYWSLPAGFVDYGEAPADAAVRECLEETGLDVEVKALVEVVSGREHVRGADIVIIYRGRIVGGTLHAADDAADTDFFAADRLPPLAFEATERAVALWQSPEMVTGRGKSRCQKR